MRTESDRKEQLMSMPKIRRTYWVALPLLAVAVAALSLTWGPSAGRETQAASTGKPAMSFVINGGECDSETQVGNCSLALGEVFTLSVVPNTIPVGGYGAWQTLIDYGNLTYKPDPLLSENKWDLSIMLARFPTVPTGKEGQVAHEDAAGLNPPFPVSFQKTSFLNLSMNCSGNNKAPGESFKTTISMIPLADDPSGGTYIGQVGQFIETNFTSITMECKGPPTSTPTPTATNTPTVTLTPTITPTKQPDPGDTDQDGCSDEAENSLLHFFGGLRDYLYFWDFFDVWTHPLGQPTAWERDKVVNISGDIFGVASRFGPGPTPVSKEASLAAALATPASSSGYHAAYDRGPIIGPNTWNRAPADGAINIPDDIFGVILQFGHSCA